MAIQFNIETFKSELNNGGARPNQFAVQLSFPNYVASRAAATAKGPFLVTTAELPGQTIPEATVFYRGRQVHMAGDRNFTPITFTVLNDSGFTIRTAIEQWMEGIEGLNTKTGRLNPSTYQTDMYIYQLDRNGAILKQYKLRNAFPLDLGAVPLSFEANDQLSSFQVSFRYQSFEFSTNPSEQLLNALTNLN
jgi:hypothetical protein